MKRKKMFAILVLALGLMVCSARVSGQIPLGTTFTYQGFLTDAKGGKPRPANGEYDFWFSLWNDPNAGTQQGSTIDINDLEVTDGYFTVELDFGSGIFTGDARWLETTVAQADGSDPCTLSPRLELTLTPYAIYALSAESAEDANMLDGYDATAFASSIHNHDGVYAPVAHNHDDRYYTETELQASGSANVHWDNLLATMPGGFADGVDNEGGVPSGIIVMWSGNIVDIPNGWVLCDGTNGTPDLRDRFIVGACGKAVVGSKGERHGGLFGSDNDLYIQTNHHPGGWTNAPAGSEMCGAHGHNLMPPYYALAYIMKLP